MRLGALPSPSPIGFMPLIRPGDLTFTAIVLQHRMVKGTTLRQAMATVRGHSAYHARSLFGQDVDQIAIRVFGNTTIAESVLTANTLFGIYSRGMSRDMAATWAQQLLHGNTYATRFLGATHMTQTTLTSHRLRSCNACIESDLASQGFAAWRVLHQVASIDRCPEHGHILVEEGAPTDGGNHRLWTPHLPGEGRSPTNSERIACIPVSDGYAGYLKLWLDVFSGNITAIEPAQWIALMNLIVTRYGGIDHATKVLETEIRRSWELPIPEIASRLSLADGWLFVHRELALKTRPKDIARRLVIYAAAAKLSLISDTKEPPIQSELTLGHLSPTDSNNNASAPIGPREELSMLAFKEGKPLALARVLTTDVSSGRAAYIVGLDRLSVRIFIARLPIGLLDDLAQLRDWGDTSWLKVELTRRKARVDSAN